MGDTSQYQAGGVVTGLGGGVSEAVVPSVTSQSADFQNWEFSHIFSDITGSLESRLESRLPSEFCIRPDVFSQFVLFTGKQVVFCCTVLQRQEQNHSRPSASNVTQCCLAEASTLTLFPSGTAAPSVQRIQTQRLRLFLRYLIHIFAAFRETTKLLPCVFQTQSCPRSGDRQTR